MVVNIYEAKTQMSKLIRLLETGEEREIVICNRGAPIARLVPIPPAEKQARPFGLLKNRYLSADVDDFFALDDEIASEMEGW